MTGSRARPPENVQLPRGTSPLKGAHSAAPGSYELVFRLSEDVLNPGDTFRCEVYVAGYGKITGAKLGFYPSPGAIDDRSSTIRFGYGLDKDVIVYGAERRLLSEMGGMLDFSGGISGPMLWNEPTMFFDVTDASPPILSTEIRGPLTHDNNAIERAAPVEYTLHTHERTRPGSHRLQFVLTYHNGVEWRTSAHVVQFSVRNLLQRHERLIAWIAAIASVATVLPPLISLIRWLLGRP